MEYIDDLQLNGLRIIRNPSLFTYGEDAVYLSDFARAKKNETVLDLCTGSAVIPILMSAKTSARHFTGLEILPEMAEMARRSVALNKLEERINIDIGNLKEAAGLYGNAAFDVITVNPPYLRDCDINPDEALAAARHETACTLEDVVRVSSKLLRYGGRMYMVHKPHRLADIFEWLRLYKLEPKTLRFVHPRAEKPPSLALVEAVLGGKPWLEVRPPLIRENVMPARAPK